MSFARGLYIFFIISKKQLLTTGQSKSSPEREVHSTVSLPKEDSKTSNKKPNLTPKRTRRTTTNKAQSKQKEGNNQD